MKALWPLVKPVLHALDPERAHDLTLRALSALPFSPAKSEDPCLLVEAFGLRFSNPIGLAAGFDKNGIIAHRASRLGFGCVEIGTVTPKPQSGNPKPRLYRLRPQEGVINRFGFNNAGHERVTQNLLRGSAVLGVNLGANKDATDRVADYVAGIRAFVGIADYFTINVSSPNTPGLRDLQKPQALDDLIARVLDARDARADAFGRKPILLKIAPDLGLDELDGVVRVARARGIDGMVVSNTTLSRPESVAVSPHAAESGGLSGRPLFDLSTYMLAQTFLRVDRQFPLVGVGGIDSADAAWAKIEAGATLVQLYTALVFKGPALIDKIKDGLVTKIREKDTTLLETTGKAARGWTDTGARFS